MKDYFKTKLGEKIITTITTGNTYFHEVFQRTYVMEVLKVNDKLRVEVFSFDTVPTGFIAGGSERKFGEIEVDINDKSKNEIVDEIIMKCDGAFIRKYNIKMG